MAPHRELHPVSTLGRGSGGVVSPLPLPRTPKNMALPGPCFAHALSQALPSPCIPLGSRSCFTSGAGSPAERWDMVARANPSKGLGG